MTNLYTEKTKDSTKVMQIGNFNITYGKEFHPMLHHFFDIIYPCFTDPRFKRIDKNTETEYCFVDVALKLIDGEYVLCGSYVKDTKYKVVTKLENGEIIPDPKIIPTAPYSRFAIFLKNHRMALVKNEPESPDIRSFQKTVETILKNYVTYKQIKDEDDNNGRKLKINVNIVCIAHSGEFKEAFKNVKKIEFAKFKIFPLNNDINPLAFFKDADTLSKDFGSTSGHVYFGSPKNIQKVADFTEQNAALLRPNIKVETIEGTKQTIKEDTVSVNRTVTFSKDLDGESDRRIYVLAHEDNRVSTCSDENHATYESVMSELYELLT